MSVEVEQEGLVNGQVNQAPEVEYFDEVTGEVLDHKGRRLNKLGQELPDPRPLRPPIGHIAQPPLHELIRTMVRSELLAREAQEAGAGTFEEEDDFDVDDEYDPTSPWEDNFEPLHPVTGEPQATPGEGQSPSETSSKEDLGPPPESPF